MKYVLLLISVGLFVWSCFSNVFVFEEGDSSFLFGLICLLFGFGEVSWYANPALLAAWIFFLKGDYKLASVFGISSVIFGLSALLIKELPRDEAGNMTRVLGFHRGYYLWMAAHLTTLLFSASYWMIVKRGKTLVPTTNTL